jgi:hypothetical protein
MSNLYMIVTTYVSTATILPIPRSAGITAAAGTRLALNLLIETWSKSLPCQKTTNCSNWYGQLPFQAMPIRKVFAPAANLSCERRLSCVLSGIEPQFPVIRHCHGCPIHHRQRLIDQRPSLGRYQVLTSSPNFHVSRKLLVEKISSAIFFKY